MNKLLDFKGSKLNVYDKGSGIPLVFLHGYLESTDIWFPFVNFFENNYRVICIDIPGHGKSDLLKDENSIDKIAESIRFVLDALFIEKCIMIGHSMGGYITMSFLENHPERLIGFCLFHSTPYADSEEKKTERDNEIKSIKNGQKYLIVETTIPKRFAEDNINRMKEEIEFAKSIAHSTSDEGIIAALEGMKNRPDRSFLLTKINIPCLWILGKKDKIINYEIYKKTDLNENVAIFLLENSGHMGFLEEPEEAEYKLKAFFNNCHSKSADI